MVDIYEFAMNMELDGKKYYEELMNSAKDNGLKRIFEMLAKDEEEHHRIVTEMRDTDDSTSISSQTMRTANNVFSEMLYMDKKFNLSASAVDAYKHALNIEEKSVKLYEEYYEKAENKWEKSIFKRLIEEEKKHRLIIENILSFVSEPERNRGVKTVDSDPEFARFES